MPEDRADPPLEAPATSLRDALARAAAGAAGALFAALLTGALSGAARAPLDRLGAATREAALFVPLGALLAPALALAAALATRPLRSALAAWAVHARRAGALRALFATAPSAVVLWVALGARLAQRFFTAFHHVGLASLALVTTLAALALAALAALAGLALAAQRRPPLEPARAPRAALAALALGLTAAAALFAYGVRSGDVHGHGGSLGALGVLARPELDLGPVYALLGLVAAGVLLTAALAQRRALALAALTLAMPLSSLALRHAALRFEGSPAAASIEARPGLARAVLRALRARFDRDRDRFSPYFGGGDCDDRDPRRNPDAIDRPGNGVDEDCSGRDAPALAAPPPPPPPPPSVAASLARALPRDANLVLLTVDTLRWDLHYAGNPRELSPNLDRLAARSVNFTRAYALSSYTGRAIGPLLAGRYPTECARDSEHFVRYLPANVLLPERLHDAGFRTLGVASHFYFERRFGFAQGMDVWDLSAKPEAAEQETASTDAAVADRAIALLRAPENERQRFFLWAHFFDPHKQYVPHPELGVSFGSGERARYDAEVAWTDRQVGRILDALAERPFADRTIVVLTADHGEAFNEHNMNWHGYELWDELVRVPLLVYVPGVPPRRVTRVRSQVDLAPTLVELLGLPQPARDAPDAFSGQSLAPELLGHDPGPRPVYLELPEGPYNSLRRAMIDEPYKLLERGTRRFYLYDLDRDPGEREDLANAASPAYARVRETYERLRGALRVVPAQGAP